MSEEKPVTYYRKDYREPDYWIDQVDLDFELEAEATEVTAILSIRRNETLEGDAPPLVLDGEELETLGVWLDGEALSDSAYANCRRPQVPSARPNHVPSFGIARPTPNEK